MNEDVFRLMELSQQGYCCSQSIVQMGLEAQGKADPDLIRALGGLCGGMRRGNKTCGALSGAACLLSLYLGKGGPDEVENERAKELIGELIDWFDREHGASHGGSDCLQLLDGDMGNRSKRCSQIVLSAYQKSVEILKSAGTDIKGKPEEA